MMCGSFSANQLRSRNMVPEGASLLTIACLFSVLAGDYRCRASWSGLPATTGVTVWYLIKARRKFHATLFHWCRNLPVFLATFLPIPLR